MTIQPEQLANGSEDGEQKALFCWAALNVNKYPSLRWMHAIPNGGFRNIKEAVNLKAAGVKQGILDIFLPLPMQSQWAVMFAGLYIEMKIEKRRNEKNGGCSEAQIEFQKYANSVGYRAVVCYGWKEAVEQILKYLNGE